MEAGALLTCSSTACTCRRRPPADQSSCHFMLLPLSILARAPRPDQKHCDGPEPQADAGKRLRRGGSVLLPRCIGFATTERNFSGI